MAAERGEEQAIVVAAVRGCNDKFNELRRPESNFTVTYVAKDREAVL